MTYLTNNPLFLTLSDLPYKGIATLRFNRICVCDWSLYAEEGEKCSVACQKCTFSHANVMTCTLWASVYKSVKCFCFVRLCCTADKQGGGDPYNYWSDQAEHLHGALLCYLEHFKIFMFN